MQSRLVLALLPSILSCFIIAACSPGGDSSEQQLTVFAASSLTTAFEELGEQFARDNEAVEVDFNFAGSPALLTQLLEGADADIFAPADAVQMQAAIENDLIAGEPRAFVTNSLVIVMPNDNPAGLENAADLANSEIKLVVAAQGVPAGDYARETLARMSEDPEYGPDFATNVMENVVSEENNVRQVLTKVQLGETDAGIVYRTDAVAVENDILRIEIPAKHNISAEYPIGIVDDGDRAVAQDFIDFLLTEDAQLTLERFGFQRVEHQDE